MRPIIKLIQYILSRKIQLNSWQALIKPWDGFCGPLEVWTHPLPPPDSGASFSSFGVFVFEIWVLRFRSRVLRFRDLGVFVFDRGCFVFEFWVLCASVFIFECFVFETTCTQGLFFAWYIFSISFRYIWYILSFFQHNNESTFVCLAYCLPWS